MFGELKTTFIYLHMGSFEVFIPSATANLFWSRKSFFIGINFRYSPILNLSGNYQSQFQSIANFVCLSSDLSYTITIHHRAPFGSNCLGSCHDVTKQISLFLFLAHRNLDILHHNGNLPIVLTYV